MLFLAVSPEAISSLKRDIARFSTVIFYAWKYWCRWSYWYSHSISSTVLDADRGNCSRTALESARDIA